MQMNLGNYPSLRKTYVVDFPRLSGGLNINELDYRLGTNESPEMENMWWQNGILQCRDGQTKIMTNTNTGTFYTCTDSRFWGYFFVHIGTHIYRVDPTAEPVVLVSLADNVPENGGTFFRYQDYLFYKNRGSFLRVSRNSETGEFLVLSVPELAFVPTIVMNASPKNGGGDLYQSENRLSPKKRITYNITEPTDEVHLPVDAIDAVESITYTTGELPQYTVDCAAGIIHFVTPLQPTDPVTNNTLAVVYRKTNTAAYESVMSCHRAIVYGGDTNLCIVLGGCKAQVNAVFWNGNDQYAMNAAYWPVDFYNLVGDTDDPVTGFGRQYSDLIVLKEHSIGSLSFNVEEVDGLNLISYTYATINSKTGCDLPGSIQLIENNLVFANTYQGVHMVRSSSSAYENNVECISRKINGSVSPYSTTGLLTEMQNAESVCSFDDDNRYWLCVDGHVYLWDYVLSGYADPTWFYFTEIPACGFCVDEAHHLYHFNAAGDLTKFTRDFQDYGAPIRKKYRFPTQHFGGYDRLKDIEYIIMSVRSDTDTLVHLRYTSDYEERQDLVPILSTRETGRFAVVAKRKPGCRHVRHFTVTLENDTLGADLAIVSMQIYYRLQGKER